MSGGKGWAERFLLNVIWSWIGVGVNLLAGFFLAPYLIRKLGDEQNGIWALAFAFIDYFTLFDFGFKSAAVNLISGFRAKDDPDQINEVINTSLFYFLCIGGGLFLLTLVLAGQLHRAFAIPERYLSDFALLVRIVGAGWAVAIALSVTIASLEAFQQFKIQNNIYILSLIVRSGGCAVVLYLGYGLIEMGIVTTLSQFLTYALSFRAVRRIFPELKISPKLASRHMWKKMSSYGANAFLAYIGTILLNQGPLMMIGHFRTTAFVGYYSSPSRLLTYIVEMITKIGNITMPNTAQLAAQGRQDQIAILGKYLNRYCLALFMPLGAFLVVYNFDLISVWITPGFAANSAPLILPLALSTGLAVAGQFNSSVILFGLAKHGTYARLLIVEGLLALTGIALVLPGFGILGAAWVIASLAILHRGLVTPVLLCKALDTDPWDYLSGIYLRPLLTGIPTVLLSVWLHGFLLPGKNWPQLILALGLLAVQYYAVALFTVSEPDHRERIRALVLERLRPAGAVEKSV